MRRLYIRSRRPNVESFCITDEQRREQFMRDGDSEAGSTVSRWKLEQGQTFRLQSTAESSQD